MSQKPETVSKTAALYISNKTERFSYIKVGVVYMGIHVLRCLKKINGLGLLVISIPMRGQIKGSDRS